MRAEEWREVIRGHEQSGLTIGAYCAKQQVSAASFYQWRRRLRDEGGVMKFALIEPGKDQGRGEIELRLASGETLAIPTGTDADTLRMVLGVLREPAQ